MLLDTILFIAGLALVIFGANWLVSGSSALAKKFNVSDLVIGLTIVAFGTSAPELVVNIFASSEGHHDVVMGNIIGSNIFNLFLILGLAGVITPLSVQLSTVWKEIPFSFLAIVFLYIIANDIIHDDNQVITGADGFYLLCMFVAFLISIYRNMKNDKEVTIDSPQTSYAATKIWLLIVLGLAGLIAGGKFVVSSAVNIATELGVSEKIIGLTIVAAGTSMPELATSVVAALRGNSDIAVGNVIGSNIFNIFFILAISAMVHPVDYNIKFNKDLLFLGFGTLFLFTAMFTCQKKKLDRWEAALLLGCFVFYSGYLILGEIG